MLNVVGFVTNSNGLLLAPNNNRFINKIYDPQVRETTIKKRLSPHHVAGSASICDDLLKIMVATQTSN